MGTRSIHLLGDDGYARLLAEPKLFVAEGHDVAEGHVPELLDDPGVLLPQLVLEEEQVPSLPREPIYPQIGWFLFLVRGFLPPL